MYTYSKKLTAQLLLFSFLLESCYNPHIGMGKKSIPPAQEASEGNTYHAGKPYEKHREQPTSHIFTTADNHPVKFTYHNGQWQAAVKEYGTNGSWQHRQLPVVFESGFTLEDLVDGNPTEQKQLLHICPDKDNIDHTSYVYVGKTPSQAKPNKQLLSIPAARQAASRSQVGLAQPKKAATNTQQPQEQQDPQAILALTSPWQQTGRNEQLPPPPARAASKPLLTPNSESLSQQFAQNKFINAQHTPRKRTYSLKKQNKLQHSQRAAQTKLQRAAAVNELPQPGQPSPAITPLLPLVTQPKCLADKTPQAIASQDFLAQGGQHVRFMHHNGQWQASVTEPIGVFSRIMTLPVACQRHGDVEAVLFALQAKPDKYVQRRIHVLPAAPPYLAMVYIGEQGLKGGMDGTSEASGDGEQEGASGSGPSQPLAAQGHEASLVALQALIGKGDITSTSALVDSLNAAQSPEEQQALQHWVQKYITWFNGQAVGHLTEQQSASTHEYRLLSGIRADNPDNPKSKHLLRDYWKSLLRRARESEYQEEPFIHALEHTLPHIDIAVFGGDPEELIQLANDLLARLNPRRTVFCKETYPTHRSTLNALHHALMLIQQIAPRKLNPNLKNGLYSHFKAEFKAISQTAAYYPVHYHARLLKQSLQRLELGGYQVRVQGRLRRVGCGLEGLIYLYQGVRALADLDFDLEAFKSGYERLQAALDQAAHC